ncbi:MAG TPA: ABC transporter permease [Bryobacteraceae bacterium]|nr:ABC transporter permease [Bryobacteraceae bacterium]
MSWTRFLRRRYWDQERARELQAYLDLETSENIARGMPPEEARYAARRKLGNPTLIREEIYHMNSIAFLETLWQDLRYGARQLRLSPGFALIAIASLALGIGANTAIFQLIDAVRLRTLPVRNPQELANVAVAERHWAQGNFTGHHPDITFALWEQIRDRQQAFSGIFAWSNGTFNLSPGGEARYARGLWVSADFFRVLGIEPARGRLFTAADDTRGCGSPGAVLSYGFWQREFAADPSIVGRKITLEGHPFEIFGVAQQGFSGIEVGSTFDVAIPICAEPVVRGEDARINRRHAWWLSVIGRLKPGWNVERASAQLRAISHQLLAATVPPNYNADAVKHYFEYRFAASPAGTGLSSLREDYQNPLWMLMAIAGLVLLIACANLANLMLARASVREREISVRLAIGASRLRLIRQLLSESLLLAGIGAAVGVFLAAELSRFLVLFLSTADNPLFVDLAQDWRVLAFTVALAVLTCVLFGLAPALRATHTSPAAALKSTSRNATAGPERFGLRRILVASQIALSLTLLIGALLFVRSLRNLITLDAGFRQNGILIAQLDLRPLRLPVNRREPAKRELLERIRAIPGVDAAGAVRIIPVSGSFWNEIVFIDGIPSKQRNVSMFNRITPGYFKTLATPFLAGRDFDEHDSPGSPPVAIVNETFAKKFLAGASPIGRIIRVEVGPGEKQPFYQIVGLVKDTKYGNLRDQYEPIFYVAEYQNEQPEDSAAILLHSNLPLASLRGALRNAIQAVSPSIVVEFSVFRTQIRESLLRERLMATLSGFFSFLAALLAAIGVYGVMSYMVARRRNEIGIRMALGASGGDVSKIILRECAVLLAAGLFAGTVLAFAGAWTARSMLFGLQPYDPSTTALAIAALALVALAASYLPARRASRLDPMAALRDE